MGLLRRRRTGLACRPGRSRMTICISLPLCFSPPPLSPYLVFFFLAWKAKRTRRPRERRKREKRGPVCGSLHMTLAIERRGFDTITVSSALGVRLRKMGLTPPHPSCSSRRARLLVFPRMDKLVWLSFLSPPLLPSCFFFISSDFHKRSYIGGRKFNDRKGNCLRADFEKRRLYLLYLVVDSFK